MEGSPIALSVSHSEIMRGDYRGGVSLDKTPSAVVALALESPSDAADDRKD